jgi:hypothetical protein
VPLAPRLRRLRTSASRLRTGAAGEQLLGRLVSLPAWAWAPLWWLEVERRRRSGMSKSLSSSSESAPFLAASRPAPVH